MGRGALAVLWLCAGCTGQYLIPTVEMASLRKIPRDERADVALAAEREEDGRRVCVRGSEVVAQDVVRGGGESARSGLRHVSTSRPGLTPGVIVLLSGVGPTAIGLGLLGAGLAPLSGQRDSTFVTVGTGTTIFGGVLLVVGAAVVAWAVHRRPQEVRGCAGLQRFDAWPDPTR